MNSIDLVRQRYAITSSEICHLFVCSFNHSSKKIFTELLLRLGGYIREQNSLEVYILLAGKE